MHVVVSHARPAHERSATNHMTLGHETGNDFFATQAVLRRQHRAIAKQVSDRPKGLPRLACLGSYDAKIELWQSIWSGRRFQVSMEFVVPGYANPSFLDAARMFFSPDQRPHLSHPRQMRGVQTANRSRSDNEDALQG